MVNSEALIKLETLRIAVIKLGLHNQSIIKFIDMDSPVIEITPGFAEIEGKKGDYNYINQYGCKLIWK